MASLSMKMKLVVFGAFLLLGIGSILYFDATDSQNQAENLALTMFAIIAIAAVAYFIFIKTGTKSKLSRYGIAQL